MRPPYSIAQHAAIPREDDQFVADQARECRLRLRPGVLYEAGSDNVNSPGIHNRLPSQPERLAAVGDLVHDCDSKPSDVRRHANPPDRRVVLHLVIYPAAQAYRKHLAPQAERDGRGWDQPTPRDSHHGIDPERLQGFGQTGSQVGARVPVQLSCPLAVSVVITFDHRCVPLTCDCSFSQIVLCSEQICSINGDRLSGEPTPQHVLGVRIICSRCQVQLTGARWRHLDPCAARPGHPREWALSCGPATWGMSSHRKAARVSHWDGSLRAEEETRCQVTAASRTRGQERSKSSIWSIRN